MPGRKAGISCALSGSKSMRISSGPLPFTRPMFISRFCGKPTPFWATSLTAPQFSIFFIAATETLTTRI